MNSKTADPIGTTILSQCNTVLKQLGAGMQPGEAIPLARFKSTVEDASKRDWQAIAWLPGNALKADWLDFNVYVGVGVFGPWLEDDGNVITPSLGQFMRRRKDNFLRLNAVMVDDIGTKVPLSRIRLVPSWKVCSSPGNWQYWYLIGEPVTDRFIAERFIADLLAAGLTKDGTDPGMTGVSRFGRLPIGINSKRAHSPPAPVYGTDYTFHRYTLAQLAEGFSMGVDPWRAGGERETGGVGTVNTKCPPDFAIVVDVLEAVGAFRGRTSAGWQIVCPWRHEHSNPDDETGAWYATPSPDNNMLGGFKCHHGHCGRRNIATLRAWAWQLLDEEST